MHYEVADPARGITKFKSYEIRKEMQTWTPSEFFLFQEFVDREIYKDLFHVLYFSGARIGEIRALYKTDIVKNYISVTKSIRHDKDGVTTPKNDYSVRNIPLDSTTEGIVKKYSAMKGQYLFGNEKPLSESSVGRIFRGYQKIAQEKHPDLKQIRIHDLRHTCATLFIQFRQRFVYFFSKSSPFCIQLAI